ncbi:aminotransferase class V-fold PLP-dependent enzyme [Deminuibacter soli]|uniref:Aminotransferase class V-fold PLP-dependent enzyme n=2 Tax=Deminuibacter soli TaxID=2291815 RepID=A0A3E1NG16_9BACT|nr:aminotransferase class V-fold PLP-dependent enzyme [Deminuibacter soli]
MDLSFILNEFAEDRDSYFRSVAPPIVQTSNFAFKTIDELRHSLEDEYSNWLYSRGLNPTVEILRKKLAALDGAEDCLVFNSGAAAIFAAVLANVKSGDHIVSVREPYSWALRMFNGILPRFNVSVTYIDGRDIANFEKATQANTTLYYLESPNSWTYELQDLTAVTKLAKQRNIITICDNSYCTPLFQRPIELGVDLVLQSATKYIGGHSDAVAGVLCGSSDIIRRIFASEYLNIGSGIQPFNAWLLIRGLRTLPARLERITRTTQAVLQYLQQHPLVESVLYPLDPSFPQYQLAKQQMKNAGGLLTFVLRAGNMETIEHFCESLKHILIAVSWGGYESLIMPRCASLQPGAFDAANTSHRMLRLYVGLEEADYITGDLDQAFEQIRLKS